MNQTPEMARWGSEGVGGGHRRSTKVTPDPRRLLKLKASSVFNQCGKVPWARFYQDRISPSSPQPQVRGFPLAQPITAR